MVPSGVLIDGALKRLGIVGHPISLRRIGRLGDIHYVFGAGVSRVKKRKRSNRQESGTAHLRSSTSAEVKDRSESRSECYAHR